MIKEISIGKSRKQTAVREGPLKLILNGDRIELYDISDDPGERRNMAASHPEQTEHLMKLSQIYWNRLTENQNSAEQTPTE